MKKLLTIGVMLLPLSSYASNYYISATGEYIPSAESKGSISGSGVSIPGSIDFNNGYGGLISAGRYIGDFRTELELGYRELKEKSVSATIAGTTYTISSNQKDKAISGIINLYYDIPTGSELTPYIGAGIGGAHLTNNGGSNALAYQGLIGLNYKLTESSSIFGGYRYFATNEFNIKSNVAGIAITEKADIKAHSIDIGYRYSF